MFKKLFPSALIIFVLLSCSLTNAHEFWVQPNHFALSANQLVVVQLMHGERFHGDVVVRNEPQIKQFKFVTHEGQSTPILGRHQSPDGYLRAQHSGVIVYQSNHYSNDLESERFNAYLIEEGLEHIIDERAQRGESKAIGREVYSRCAKSIIQISDCKLPANEIDQRTGLPLEILIESISSPASSEKSLKDLITASVSFMNEPIEGLRVVAVNTMNPERLIELRTDINGKIQFEAEPNENWMITTIHIRRADHIKSADWESFWASTTFTNASHTPH